MDRLETFNTYRSLLFSIAYRMLGTVMEAEDVLQEAYLRWENASAETVDSPKAYLSTVVTRLCIDALRSAQARREVYPGQWLPEPLILEMPGLPFQGPAEQIELGDSLSMAFLILLESLSPDERAVFLLREVFDFEYSEISRIVGKSEDACRQILSRARSRIAAGRPRFDVTPEQRERVTMQFAQTLATGDLGGLLSVLAEDVTSWSDGGGKAASARRPIHGAENVARMLLGLFKKAPPDLITVPALVNGEAGFVNYLHGQVLSVMALEITGDRITNLRVITNPDKLHHVPPLPT